MQILVLFHESSARDFQFIETQLLKRLHGLTSTPTSGLRHPTALFWHILWSRGRGISRDGDHLRICTTIAAEMFIQHIGFSLPWIVTLHSFSIYTLHAAGTGDPEDKTTRFSELLERIKSL